MQLNNEGLTKEEMEQRLQQHKIIVETIEEIKKEKSDYTMEIANYDSTVHYERILILNASEKGNTSIKRVEQQKDENSNPNIEHNKQEALNKTPNMEERMLVMMETMTHLLK